MAEVASAFVSLVPSARGFGRKLDGEIGSDLDGSGKRAGSRFGAALKVGAAAAVGGAVLLAGFLKGSIAEAREAQKVAALTNQVIKTTGGIANVTAKQVGNLSQAISLKTGIDDEAIQSGANLLLTFKNVRNEAGKGNKVFDRATRAAVDLSAAGFGNLSGTSKQLGKALNDPIKGISALSRSGVTFTQKQKGMIKSLVKSGNTLKAQKIILKEVESQVGGAAAASATAGEKFKVAFDNMKESVGTALLPIFDRLLVGMTRFATFITNDIGPGIAALNGFLVPVIAKFKAFFSGLSGGGPATGALLSIFDSLVAAGKRIGAALGPALASIGGMIKADLIPAFQRIMPVVAPVARFIIGILAGAVVGAIKGAVQVIKGLIGVISGVFNLIAALVNGNWRAAWNALKQIVSGAINAVIGAIKVWLNVGILAIFKGGIKAILGAWRSLWAGVRSVGAKAASGLNALVAGLVKGIARLFVSGVRGYINLWRGLFRGLLDLARTGWRVLRSAFGGALAAIRSVVVQAMSKVKAAFVSAMNAVKTAVTNGINKAREAFGNGVAKIVALAKTIGSKIIGAVRGLAGAMYNAGAALIQGLVNGIGDKMSAAIQKVKDGLRAIGRMLPSSPIKEGPLKSWNRGGAGKRLIQMGLIDGINSSAPALEDSMRRLTGRVNVASPRVNAVSVRRNGAAALAGATGAGRPIIVNDKSGNPLRTAREVVRQEAFAGVA